MILVIGGTGTVGAEVVRELNAGHHKTRALVRDPDRAHAAFAARDQAELFTGDLDRPETLPAALDGVDRVFLLTVPGERQLHREQAVIEAAKRAGVNQIVRLSRTGAAAHSPLRLARTHWLADQQLKRSGLGRTIVRPPFLMQNLPVMVEDGAIRRAMGEGRLAMIDARDVAAVAATALTGDGHDERTYVVTGPQSLSLAEAARTITRQGGGTVRYVRLSPEDVRRRFLNTGLGPQQSDDAAMLDSLCAAGHDELVTDEVRALTGRPARTLADFAAEFGAEFAGARPARGHR